MFWKIAASLIVLSYSLNSMGWGVKGHRIVADIATSRLDKKTLAEIKLLMPESLADASVWADNIRSDQVQRIEIGKLWTPDKFKDSTSSKILANIVNQWHFFSIPDGQTPTQVTRSPWGDLDSAIRLMIASLKNKKLSKRQRGIALKLLIHFIGDLHQPLHVGLKQDYGANNCWVNWFPERYPNISPKPKPTNEYISLHKVWDTKLIESTLMTTREFTKNLLTPNPRRLSLSRDTTKQSEPKKLAKQFKSTLDSWAHQPLSIWILESLQLRQQVYPGPPQSGLRNYCYDSAEKKIDPSIIPEIGWGERYKMLRIVEVRLLQAGVRLAETLQTSLK